MSLEEERARQTAATSIPTLAPVPEAVDQLLHTPATGSAFETPMKAEVKMETDEDADLKAALALSRGDDVEMAGEEDEDEEMRKAIAMSMKEEEE